MNKTELVEQVSKNTGLTKKNAALTVDVVFKEIQKSLIAEGQVRLPGFGSFIVREHSERQARNPQTGEKITVPSKKVPAFKPGKSLKMAIKDAELKKAN